MFVYLLRFAEAEPQTPAAFRRQLQHMAQYFIARGRQPAAADWAKTGTSKIGGQQDTAASGTAQAFYRDSLFAAFFWAIFLAKTQPSRICRWSEAA